MQKKLTEYIRPLPSIGDGNAACLLRTIESFGKTASLYSLALELDRYGSDADGMIRILNRYGIVGRAASLTSDRLEAKAPCIIASKEGFVFLEKVKESYTVIDGEGRKKLSVEEFRSSYLGQVIEIETSEGFNLTEERPFKTLNTFSEVGKSNKLRVFALNFCCFAAIILTVMLAVVLKAHVEESIIGRADGIVGGAAWMFTLLLVLLFAVSFVAFKIKRSLISMSVSAIDELAADRADRIDPAVYSYRSKREILSDMSGAARQSAGIYCSQTYAVWGITSSAVFCALSFVMNPLCAIPVGIAFVVFGVVLSMGRNQILRKYLLHITAAASYIAVIGVIGTAAFMSFDGVTPADTVALAIYSLMFAFSATFSAKMLVDRRKMYLSARLIDSFMNTDIYSIGKGMPDELTLAFKNASIYSSGRLLAENVELMVKPQTLTVIRGRNTSAVLKAAAGACFDVTGSRTIGGMPYSQAGSVFVNQMVFVGSCDIREGTVADNIRRFDREVPLSEVYRAARTLNITDMIMKSLGSFEFVLAENGRNVSDTIQCGIMLSSLLIRKPKYAFISKEALLADKKVVSEMLGRLVENGITVVTDRETDNADRTIDINKKTGGKSNG